MRDQKEEIAEKDVKEDNSKITIEFVRIGEDASLPLPVYQTEGSSGMDVRASEDALITAKSWGIVKTGLKAEIPSGYEIQVRSRSGLAFKNGIFVLNSPGTVDSDYRGEIMVILANFSDNDFKISKGDRIAQLVVASVVTARIKETSEVSETLRSDGGFGHSGIK